MRIEPEFDNASVVLLGSFNPMIFQPAWFARHKMIGDKEAEEAANLVQFQGQVVEFKVDAFELNVQSDRFIIGSLDDHPEHIKDLVISCFGKHLPHTPVRAIGINRSIHFNAGDFDATEYVGSQLAPKDAWGEWGEEIKKARDGPIDKRGGMLSITMLQQNLQLDEYNCSVQAKVEPSNRIETRTGILVGVNNHFESSLDKESVQDASLVTEVLEVNWNTSMKRAAMIADQIMALVEEHKNESNNRSS